MNSLKGIRQECFQQKDTQGKICLHNCHPPMQFSTQVSPPSVSTQAASSFVSSTSNNKHQ